MRTWDRHVACTGMKIIAEYLTGISEGKRQLRKHIRWRMTLKWILKKYPADQNGGVV
jgi:hypothetical protein